MKNHRNVIAVCCWTAALFFSRPTSGQEVGPLPNLPAPEDAICVQAESMQCDTSAWKVVEYSYNASGFFYGYPLGLKWLEGVERSTGTASTTVVIPKAGAYRLWVRCQDQPQAPFTLAVQQAGKAIVTAAFNASTARAPEKDDVAQGWGTGPQLMAWWHVDADLAAGSCSVQLTQEKATPGNVPRVDCLVFTREMKYVPCARDFQTPLYLRLVTGPTQPQDPMALYFWGRLSTAPFVTCTAFVTKNGLYRDTALNGVPRETYLRPGDSTPWVNIAPYLDPRCDNRIRFYTMTNWWKFLSTADFTLELAHAPDAKPFKTFHREGTGCSIVLVINPTNPEAAYSNIEGSRSELETAKRLPARGRQPKSFASFTGLNDSETLDPEAALQGDLLTLRALGFTGANVAYNQAWQVKNGITHTILENFCYHLVKEPGCLSQPRPDAMREMFSDTITKYYRDQQDTKFIRVMDEIYSVEFEHLKKCQACAAKFRDYLKQQGLKPQDLVENIAVPPGQDAWEMIKPTDDRKGQPRLYYYSVMFRCQVLVDFMKTVTGVIQEIKPGLRTAANTSIELTYAKNMIERGADYFGLYRSGALGFGFVADANSFQPSNQTASFTIDVLRAACRKNKLPYGCYNVSSAPAWDIQAKGFAEVGRGCSMISYYDYGPYHSDSADPMCHRPGVMGAFKAINYATGAIEDELPGAVPARTPIALLYSKTTDAWSNFLDADFATNSGNERIDLYLLLRHLGYPIDILDEDDILEGRATNYRAIFVAESHLKDGVLPKLLEWTKQGGFLYLGAGSATRGKFNEPLRDLDDIGLKREPYTFKVTGTSWPDGFAVVDRVMLGDKPLEAAGGAQKVEKNSEGQIVLRFADGSPCGVHLPCGKGQILYVGFFPGTSYVRLASIPQLEIQNKLIAEGKPVPTYCSDFYPSEYRELMQALLAPLKYIPPVRVSRYNVEACLLEGKTQYILSLANWTGKTQPIDVSVDLARPPGKPSSVINRLRNVHIQGKTLTFSMDLGPGDFIRLPITK